MLFFVALKKEALRINPSLKETLQSLLLGPSASSYL